MYAQYAPQAGVNRLRVIQVRQRLIAERSPRELRNASKCVFPSDVGPHQCAPMPF